MEKILPQQTSIKYIVTKAGVEYMGEYMLSADRTFYTLSRARRVVLIDAMLPTSQGPQMLTQFAFKPIAICDQEQETLHFSDNEVLLIGEPHKMMLDVYTKLVYKIEMPAPGLASQLLRN